MVQRIEFDNGKVIYKKACNDIKVIIMAGGKGTRLLPLTDVLPKPLSIAFILFFLKASLIFWLFASCKFRKNGV